MNFLNKNKHFPTIVGYNDSFLKNLAQNIDKEYTERTEYKIDKLTGNIKTYSDGTKKTRVIRPSKKRLKALQKIVVKRILNQFKLPSNIYGGVKGKSNISNAKVHQGKKYIFTTDLQDFFPSIKTPHVYQKFINLGFSTQFTTYIIKFTTWKGELPQGTPTSNGIANLLFLDTDYLLIELCNNHKITYTRFVDDLTFSSQQDFSEIIPTILKIVKESGFKISYRKTDYKKNQIITGVQVFNHKIDASPDIIKKIKRYEKDSKEDPTHLKKYRERILSTNTKK